MKEIATNNGPTIGNSTTGSTCSVSLNFHLAGVKRCTPEECEEDSQGLGISQSSHVAPPNVARAFLKVHSLVELDTFTLTHGPFTALDTPGWDLFYIKE